MVRLFNRIKHALERFIVRGATYQLLLVAALIGLISVIGGALIVAGVDEADSLGDSIWWAFLRLTDPGYLGDDSGTFRRVISTIVTVLGYVLFMGSLVAILTQWLNATIKKLESGYTPVARDHHILVFGWTERVGIVVRDLFLSENRVKRFLARRGERRLHIVVLAEQAGAAMRNELKGRVGAAWNSSQVTLRSGSPLRSDHLERVDFLHASAVILPAGDFSDVGPVAVDTHTIKALLLMSNHPEVRDPEQLPLAVAEVLDARKVEIAEAAYAGPLEVLASDVVISRLLAQNIRHRGLSHAYQELLTHRVGNELFVREFPELYGTRVCELSHRFEQAIPVGIVRPEEGGMTAHLNPGPETIYQSDDRLVLVAREYEATGLSSAKASARPVAPAVERQPAPVASRSRRECRLLVLGWNHKIPSLLMELSQGEGETHHVAIASAIPAAERRATLSRHAPDLGDIEICHEEIDYTMPTELAGLDVGSYDNILLVGSDWLSSGEESDARTIVGYLTLQKALARCETRPNMIVEILDPSNVDLLGERPGEVLVSPVILSHMLAQISLRRELNAVFDELFSFGGTEITFKSPADYDYVGAAITFAEFQREAAQHGDIALGFLSKDAAGKPLLQLNPSRSATFELSEADELVILSDRPKPSAGDRGEPRTDRHTAPRRSPSPDNA